MSYEAYAQNTLQPVERIAVSDSKGKKFGDFPLSFAYSVKGSLVVLGFEPSRIVAGGFNTFEVGLAFQSSDCSGTPFADLTGIYSPWFPPTFMNGTKLYALDGPAQEFHVFSDFNGSTCEQVEFVIPAAAPVRLLIDLATEFHPPFTMRASGTP